MSEMVHKVTLSTSKVVILKEFKIKHETLAAQAIASKTSNDNMISNGMLLQQEILKLLLVSIDGQAPGAAALEDLDGLFNYREYRECLQVVKELMGGDETAPKIEIVSSGT